MQNVVAAAAAEVAIIDDDLTQRAATARLLQSVGLAACAYESAEAFLREMSAGDDGASPGCILTDMRMPGMSGLQLQHELATRHLCVPLIVLTGHADVPAAVRSMKAGAFDFIEKPCSPQLLLENIQDALRQSDQLRRQQDEHRAIRDRYTGGKPTQGAVRSRTTYLFSGVLVCDACGGPMTIIGGSVVPLDACATNRPKGHVRGQGRAQGADRAYAHPRGDPGRRHVRPPEGR